MIEPVGIIGVGHLASYLVEGLKRAVPEAEIFLSRYLGEETEQLVDEYGAIGVADNQAVADAAGLVLVTTRPGDVLDACGGVDFGPDHLVVSTAVGVSVDALIPAVAPAPVVRAMPLTCAAINRSPTLLYPEHLRARRLFELLGTVHALDREEPFGPASLVAAFYGWVYALLDKTIAWTAEAGVPPGLARELVLETARGAAEMGLAHPQEPLADLLDSLATPGGITRQGLEVLEEREGLDAWVEALEAVLQQVNRGS